MLSPTVRQTQESWNTTDRRTLRRKGPKVLWSKSPCVFWLLAHWLSVRELRGKEHTNTATGGREQGTGKHNPPAVVARCHRKTESCCGASTGEPLLDLNTVLSKQNPCMAAQESVTRPKAGSSTGRTSQPVHRAAPGSL